MTEVTVYTVAGSVTSAFVGATLGWLGGLVFPQPVGRGGIAFALAVAVIAMARELGWVKFPLLQLRRQTRDIWAKIFPSIVAAGQKSWLKALASGSAAGTFLASWQPALLAHC